jgi:hypothetical protein
LQVQRKIRWSRIRHLNSATAHTYDAEALRRYQRSALTFCHHPKRKTFANQISRLIERSDIDRVLSMVLPVAEPRVAQFITACGELRLLDDTPSWGNPLDPQNSFVHLVLLISLLCTIALFNAARYSKAFLQESARQRAK